MTRSRDRTPDHPAAVYRDSLSRGSYWAVHHSLTTIVTDPAGKPLRLILKACGPHSQPTTGSSTAPSPSATGGEVYDRLRDRLK